MNALVLQHGSVPPAPPGLLADWAAARGIPLDIHRADLGEPPLLERGRHHAEPAARAAFDLFDAFWERTRT
jgi:hypothetical protein